MKKVLLDTNFILTCIREKIDFFEDLNLMGLKIVIPKEVILEIEKIIESKKKLRFKSEARLAEKILSKNKFQKLSLNDSYVDKGIIKFSKENPFVLIGTLDRELKKKLKSGKVVIRAKKKLGII
jgi:rRNA-processing protein FCF1